MPFGAVSTALTLVALVLLGSAAGGVSPRRFVREVGRDLRRGLLGVWAAFRGLWRPWAACRPVPGSKAPAGLTPPPAAVTRPVVRTPRPRTVLDAPGRHSDGRFIVGVSSSAAWPRGFASDDETLARAVGAWLDERWPLPVRVFPQLPPCGDCELVTVRDGSGRVCRVTVDCSCR